MSVARIGVSLGGSLLEEFDRYVAEKGFDSRSEALRALIREALTEKRVAEGGEVVGTITFVYRHDVGTVTHGILHRQHDFVNAIRATAHTHLSDETCLEVLLVQGKAVNVLRLADRIRTARGVLFEQTVMTSPDLR
ncbi:MAG TPA: nickel-responsive transcriptional regulator NikR [Thermoplasmata archaeon]|nr:nickel-responsive transcriptional regulator NikR [Thermoplasmata archaeon]